MAVDRDTVKRIAKLARLVLRVSAPRDEEELNAMLALVEQLRGRCRGRPAHDQRRGSRLKMREDAVSDGGYKNDLMKKCAASEGHSRVPKVVEWAWPFHRRRKSLQDAVRAHSRAQRR